MSDFVFLNKRIEQGKITKAIQSIYNENKLPLVKEFHGEWGSLGVSRSLYQGFEPYENEKYIAVIIGGPLLMFRNNSFLNDKNSFKGTKAIFQRWLSGKIKWDSDLSGPFAMLIVNKQNGYVTCITDLMSFIPVYSYQSTNSMALSTHVDVLAKVSKSKEKFDKISILDFILYGVVTYPYTMYTDIFQIQPASEHKIKNNVFELKSTCYWLPIEFNKYNSINEAADHLRNSLHVFINKITRETTNIAQFISAGEDSRTLSGLLQNSPRNAYVFLDNMNREGNIAKRVAHKYNATFKLATRDQLHYLDILPSCSDLVGSGSQYHHAHTYGFHNTIRLNSYTAVFGGLFSDALLKGARIKKINGSGSGRFSFIPEIKNFSYSPGKSISNSLFTSDVLLELTQRRQSHLEYVKRFRKKSAEEWFELWPSSMNMNIPNIHANRRLFRSYEPFMSSEIVKISSSIPQGWKLNRRLFNRTAKPLLESSKWLFHGDGWLPYFPWYINTLPHFSTWLYRQIAKRLGLIKGNQGPWGEWSVVVKSKEWNSAFIHYSESLERISDIFNDETSIQEIQNVLSRQQYVNLTQVMYQIKE